MNVYWFKNYQEEQYFQSFDEHGNGHIPVSIHVIKWTLLVKSFIFGETNEFRHNILFLQN